MAIQVVTHFPVIVYDLRIVNKQSVFIAHGYIHTIQLANFIIVA